MSFLSDLMDHLIDGAARDHAKKARPSRNTQGVTSLEVCRLDAGDVVETVFTNLPNGAIISPLLGTKVLYVPHPTLDTYLVVRDHTGAPGSHLSSIAFVRCGDPECEDCEDE